jgi:hypothetical protein
MLKFKVQIKHKVQMSEMKGFDIKAFGHCKLQIVNCRFIIQKIQSEI